MSEAPKDVVAQPMTLGAYYQFRVMVPPQEADLDKPGYLVVWDDDDGEYLDWIPQDEFLAKYEKV